MELGPESHNKGGLLGPNSIIGAYVDPLGKDVSVTEIIISKSVDFSKSIRRPSRA